MLRLTKNQSMLWQLALIFSIPLVLSVAPVLAQPGSSDKFNDAFGDARQGGFNAGLTSAQATTVTIASAAISVNKTVGTNASTCAVSNSVTLLVSGPVTYCYQVTNTGSVTLTRHTLTDNRLGTILSNFPYTLVPGASAFLTQTATITQNTVNTATWTAFNPGPIDVVTATDIATVTFASAAISVNKTVGTNPSNCASNNSLTLPPGGGSVTYCYTVANTGPLTLTRHTLTDNRLGTILSNFPYTLVPGASAFLTQTTTLTQTTVNTATWTAFNPGPTNVTTATDVVSVAVTSNFYLPLILKN